MKNRSITVHGAEVTITTRHEQDYISLTDMVKRFGDESVLYSWLRNRNTIEFLGIWEQIYNPTFKPLEFERFKSQAGLNSFSLSPKKWIDATDAIGLYAKAGRGGGTYAHKDIAFEFGMWISAEFKIYLIKEFQRLKETEREQLGWDIRRNLTKINYRLHTDAIKARLVPPQLQPQHTSLIYASEADLLNMALFGKTAKQWRDENPGSQGNIRDQANAAQLVCLANLEALNAHLIHQGLAQAERLALLNQTAIHQMTLLLADAGVQQLQGKQP